MAFVAQTEDKESLQAVAFALRQDKGSAIEPDEVKSAMQDFNALPGSVRNSCGIDAAKLASRFNNWVTLGSPDDVESWINSSVWTANAVIKSAYIRGSDYIFYNTIGDPFFRGAYREIAKHIAANAKDTKVKSVYSIMSKGTGDKWNPADVIAIKKSKAKALIKQMQEFKALKPSPMAVKDKEMSESFKKRKLSVVEDMKMLYSYNQWVDFYYKNRECVPISLKKVSPTAKELKAVTSPSVKMKSFDHKEMRGIKEAIKLKIDITNVKFEATNAKCIVEFTLANEKGHKMDIRGFQSAINNDVQMQLQKGSAANHGKATLSIFAIITKMSGGRMAFSSQRAKLRKLFPKIGIPTGKDHNFTNYSVFQNYAEKKDGTFSKKTFMDHLPLWADYIQFLSGGKHKAKDVINYTTKEYDKNPTKGAKWLKNKVQSYEVGSVVDKKQKQIKEIVKTNIMKSIYSQAASKGFRIFGDNSITDYMTASSYLKMGG